MFYFIFWKKSIFAIRTENDTITMGNENKYRILVVDDEENICEVLQYNLQRAGYEVDTAHSAEEALSIVKTNSYNLLLLDIMMGGMSGVELAQVLRQDYKKNTPIIFLSALDTEPDILKGFRIGADDYIPKPFSINQVIARVGAVLNRYAMAQIQKVETSTHASALPSEMRYENVITIENLIIKADERKAFVNNQPLLLTKTEFGILTLLAQNKEKIVSREEILTKVWNGNTFVVQRTVDVHIARLRKKMEGANAKIVNHIGWGYSLEESTL